MAKRVKSNTTTIINSKDLSLNYDEYSDPLGLQPVIESEFDDFEDEVEIEDNQFYRFSSAPGISNYLNSLTSESEKSFSKFLKMSMINGRKNGCSNLSDVLHNTIVTHLFNTIK